MSDPVLDLTTWGEFAPEGATPSALTLVRVELLTVDLISEWGRCSTVADFLAGYLAANFDERRTAALVLSTVANELVENAAKFSAGPEFPVRITAHHFGDALRIDVGNVVAEERARVFVRRLEELRDEDVETLFLSRLVEPTGGIGSGAGIGLMILKKDYGARLAARLLPRPDDRLYQVEVQVTLTSQEIEQR